MDVLHPCYFWKTHLFEHNIGFLTPEADAMGNSYICSHTYTHICICICIWISIFYLHIYIYMYIYILLSNIYISKYLYMLRATQFSLVLICIVSGRSLAFFPQHNVEALLFSRPRPCLSSLLGFLFLDPPGETATVIKKTV